MRILLPVALCALLSWPSAVGAQVFQSETGRVEFTSSVPLHTFTGESDRLTGRVNLADSTADFYVDLTTLRTGIGKRDRDMRLTLEVDRFPFAEFFGRILALPDLSDGGGHPVQVRGQFSIHGVSREVTVSGTMTRTDEGLHIEAAWELNLRDYDIVPPSLLVVKVDEVQAVRIDTMLKPRQP